jgi:hypothetical protein
MSRRYFDFTTVKAAVPFAIYFNDKVDRAMMRTTGSNSCPGLSNRRTDIYRRAWSGSASMSARWQWRRLGLAR